MHTRVCDIVFSFWQNNTNHYYFPFQNSDFLSKIQIWKKESFLTTSLGNSQAKYVINNNHIYIYIYIYIYMPQVPPYPSYFIHFLSPLVLLLRILRSLIFLINYVEFEEKVQYFCRKVIKSQKYFSQKVVACLSVKITLSLLFHVLYVFEKHSIWTKKNSLVTQGDIIWSLFENFVKMFLFAMMDQYSRWSVMVSIWWNILLCMYLHFQ